MQSGGKRVALVVGSGGVKCAAALGLWKVLQREGIEVSVAVGCSGGSIFATLMALGADLQTAEEKTRKLWTIDIMKGYSTNLREAQSGAHELAHGREFSGHQHLHEQSPEDLFRLPQPGAP